MNTETYRQIAVDLLHNGQLPEDGAQTLERAKGVLQLGDKKAAIAYAAAAAPHMMEVVDNVAAGLDAASVKEGLSALAEKQKELSLSVTTSHEIAAKGFLAKLRALYDDACKAARAKNNAGALEKIDQAIAFSSCGEAVLADLREGSTADHSPDAALDVDSVEAVPLTLPADQLSARRLYGIYLERSLDGEAGEASPPDELARVLELSEADEEVARVEVCQPRLKALYTDSIKKAQGDGPPLNLAKLAVGAELAKFKLPGDSVEETAKAVYKERLGEISEKVLKAEEKGSLDAARGFLELTEEDVRLMHLKAFGKTYEMSVNESMGRGGVMTAAAQEALTQLRERLGLSEEDCEKIFYGVVETRLKEMMADVTEAWEEATYSKEALAQVWKERGKDVGDDIYADGSGDGLGITDGPKLEGVRGSKLMDELCKVTTFYLSNKVLKEGTDVAPEDMYPVAVGKYIEDKAKEEMYGVFAWNAVTCQDGTARAEWNAAKPHVAGILGLSPDAAQKVMNRMVSRWANMFIKQKFQEKGELGTDDVSTLTEWVPTFFGIDKAVTADIVQGANKGVLQSKVMRLLNKPEVTPSDLQNLRDDVERFDLRLEKDLELSRPQLRNLFRVEVASAIEDPDVPHDQKQDQIASSRESFGLEEGEAMYELQDMLFSRCRGCLVNAVGDLMQGNEAQAMEQMQRLELLAAFCHETDGVHLKGNWEVAPGMRKKLVEAYAKSAGSDKSSGHEPDIGLLQKTLEIAK